MFKGFEYMITVTLLEMKVSLPLTTVTLRAFKYGRRPSTSIFKGMRTGKNCLTNSGEVLADQQPRRSSESRDVFQWMALKSSLNVNAIHRIKVKNQILNFSHFIPPQPLMTSHHIILFYYY